MPLHFPCLNITKNQGSQRYSMMSQFQTGQQTREESTQWKPRYKNCSVHICKDLLICFFRLEFCCWFGSLVIKLLQTKKSPRGSSRWMNHRGNITQLLRSTLYLKKKVAKHRTSFCINLYRLWDMSSPAMSAREPLRRKTMKKENQTSKKPQYTV